MNSPCSWLIWVVVEIPAFKLRTRAAGRACYAKLGNLAKIGATWHVMNHLKKSKNNIAGMQCVSSTSVPLKPLQDGFVLEVVPTKEHALRARYFLKSTFEVPFTFIGNHDDSHGIARSIKPPRALCHTVPFWPWTAQFFAMAMRFKPLGRGTVLMPSPSGFTSTKIRNKRPGHSGIKGPVVAMVLGCLVEHILCHLWNWLLLRYYYLILFIHCVIFMNKGIRNGISMKDYYAKKSPFKSS